MCRRSQQHSQAAPGPGHGWASLQKRAVILLPPSYSNQYKSYFSFDVQFHGEFVFLEVCETALGRLPCPSPVLSRGNHSGHAALTTLVQFLPQAGKGVGLARSLLFSCLPVLPLPDELGVTCIPSACPPSLKTRDLHFQQTSLSPGGQEGRPSPPTLLEACRCIS